MNQPQHMPEFKGGQQVHACQQGEKLKQRQGYDLNGSRDIREDGPPEGNQTEPCSGDRITDNEDQHILEIQAGILLDRHVKPSIESHTVSFRLKLSVRFGLNGIPLGQVSRKRSIPNSI